MNPLLVITYIVNLILATSVFGIIGLFAGLLGSGAIYLFISQKGSDRHIYWGQLLAIIFGHIIGFVAVVFAPWSTPLITAVALIIEACILAIFIALGKE